MTDSWRISQVAIKGFRGVADNVTFGLVPGLNILVGPNGAGKTSICHAIEWALFGKVPSFAGSEFQDEDSIANRFAEGPSEVRLTLARSETALGITRVRARGASSTRGASKVTVALGSAQFAGSTAEALLEKELGVPHADLGAGFYLRQDTVADIVLGDAQVRSAAIDRMLGLGEVRLLLQNLQLAAIERATKSLDAEIRTLQETVITAASLRREQLYQQRQGLAEQGITESDLTMAGAIAFLSRAFEQLQQLAGVAELLIPAIDTAHQTPAELRAAGTSIGEETEALSRRLESLAESLTSNRATLGSLQNRLKLAEASFAQLSSSELESIESTAATLRREMQEASQEIKALGSLLADATPLASQLKGLHSEVAALSGASSDAQVEALERERDGLRDEWKRIDSLLKAHSSLDQLLASARAHLRDHPQDRCPVCTQPIDAARVSAQLEAQQAASKSQAGELQARQNEIQAAGQKLVEQISSHKVNLQRLVTANGQIDKLMNQLQQHGLAIASSESETVHDAIGAVAAKHKARSEARSELAEQLAKAEASLSKYKSVASELAAVKDEIRGILGAAGEHDELSDLLGERIALVEQRSKVIEGARSDLRDLQLDLSKIQAIIGHLQDIDDAKRLEEDVPAVRTKLRQLEAAKRRLATLYQTVAEIHSALTTVQQQALSGNLSSLMPSTQALFETLGAHPEYSRLVVEPLQDARTGTNVYRLRAETTNDVASSTFVRTTFSRGELNSVALALFLAVAAADRGTFGLSVLDDPSQSLDVVRQKGLVSALESVAQSRQVVIASEDGDFAEMCRTAGAHVINLTHAPFAGTSATPELQLA